jgi:hypothetical protein
VSAVSYSGDPSSSVLDEVRFLISDTNTSHERLSDEEITYAINKLRATYTDALMYAAYCADRIADLYAGEVSISADGVSISTEQLQDKYRTMATALRNTYAALHGVGATPYAGGTVAGEEPWGTKALNFGIGMSDNDSAGRQGFHRPGDYDNDGEGWR